MAMAARVISSVTGFTKALMSDSFSTQRSTVARALICPNFTNPEQSRNFASASAPKEQKIKVPVAMFGGSGNYASALYIVAAKANALDKVESELLDFVSATTKASTFSQFMKDLAVSILVDFGAGTIKEENPKLDSEIVNSDEELARMLQTEEEALMLQQFGVSPNNCQFERRIRHYVDQVLLFFIRPPSATNKSLNFGLSSTFLDLKFYVFSPSR